MRLVPMALPLAILLASIMTFGNLGEFYELTAIKSSGVSVAKFMRPLLVFAVFLGIFAFYFSNNILPIANLKAGSLLYDIREQIPAFDLKPGVFYNGLSGFTLKIDKKMADNQTLQGIKIWDHRESRGNVKLLMAEKGTMTITPDRHYLSINLYNGNTYEESLPRDGNMMRRPHTRTSFLRQNLNFDLSAFKMERTDEESFKSHFSMLNVTQLHTAIDSITDLTTLRKLQIADYINAYFLFKSTKNYDSIPAFNNPLNFYKTLDTCGKATKIQIYADAIRNVEATKGYLDMMTREDESNLELLSKHEIELHRKFTLSVACMVLFILGAPLGAIIRKGGLGTPMLFAILFFVIYYMISITGEKLTEQQKTSPWTGMWASTCILLPIGLFLLYKANNDSKLFDGDFYKNIFKKKTP
jgi:lipopolysaccharide export system permease protein